jgi:hypothetical protein
VSGRKRFLTDHPDFEWCGQYILGGPDGHTPEPCYSLLEWGRWLADIEHRRIAYTGNDVKWVSTVFLGLDQRFLWGGGPPLVFESMAFVHEGRMTDFGRGPEPVPETLDQVRYSSWDDAEAGHKAMVRKYLIDAKTRAKGEAE